MDEQKIINDNLRLFDPMAKRYIAGKKRGISIAINTGNKKEHERKKFDLAYDLLKEGKTIITEGKLKNGKRPDLVVLNELIPTAYEIMCTESEESIEQKRKDYKGIEIIEVRI